MKNNLTVYILIGMLLEQNTSEASLDSDSVIDSRINFVNETLLSIPKTGSAPSHCHMAVSNTLDIEKLVMEINNGFEDLENEIFKGIYKEPKLKISGLSKSENFDLNLALRNAIEYAKKVEKNPKGQYEIPRIKIHGLTKHQEDELNSKIKGEVIDGPRPGGPGDNMGIIGVAFVIVAGGIMGHSLAKTGPIVIPPATDPNKEPIGNKDIIPYREGAGNPSPLGFSQTARLLNNAKSKKGR